MSALPGAPPSLSLSPPPLPGPGSALDSQHLSPHHRRDHPLSIFHLPNAPAPAPRGQDQSVHVGKREEGRIRLNCCKQFRGVGCVEAPPFVFHVAWRVMLALSVQFMCPCGRLAGSWRYLPVCVLFVCLCLGRSSGAPSPRDPCSVYAGAPMPAFLFVCPVVLSGVCVFFGTVACMSLWLCWCLLSLLYLCVHLGICLSIPLVLCPQLSPWEREDSDAAPPINSCLTAFLCSVTPQKWTPE